MSLANTTVWEVRTTGNDGNGGGWDTASGGTDFSQQNAAQATLTVASTLTAANQVTVAVGDYTCVAGDVGNTLQISGGTATAGFYRITAVAGQVWTLDRNAGVIGNTVVGAMGGAMASPGMIGNVVVAGNIVYIQAGTYSMSVNTNNVSNGKWSKSAGVLIIGYNTNRQFNQGDTRPVIQATVSLTTMWNGPNNWVYNIDFDANSQATTKCVDTGAFTRCIFRNATAANAGIVLASHCTATGNSGVPFFISNGAAVNCEAYSNTAVGFSLNNATATNCISYNNSGASSDGFQVPALMSGHCFNCVAYNNGRDGFRTILNSTFISRMILENCVAENNAGWGANSAASLYPSLLIKCSFYNNTSGATTGSTQEIGTVAPSGSVFTSAGTSDFSLNNTANQGALLRGTGNIDVNANTFPTGTTTAYPDIGAAQHQDSGGGGSSPFSAAYLG